ncbi:tetratricopeptide repeat protein [Puniceicoccus vermicola]|uniref:Tetratricopeptide repeat protein n=1 Tax=Puniceicoccus vermicola TaxID=388746 RepID=A0A7X1AVC9_9BACT|nr:tetratricopeptide repeat protein [Puniceicoccus vermicola]MBC2600706.1 tetratricopeptide repeat protein [Puniceicoccus vermicola]
MARPSRSVLRWFFPLFFSLFFLTACSDPEAKFEEQLAEASALIDQGQYDQAIELLNQLDEKYPDRGVVLQELGRAYEESDVGLFAGVFYEKAAQADAEFSELLFPAARFFAEEGDRNRALSTIDDYLELYPDDAEAWRFSAELLAENQRFQSALSAHLRAERLDGPSRNPEYAATMGELYMQAGNIPQAEIHFQTALSEAPDDRFRALMGLLGASYRAENFPQAEEILATLNEEFPGAVESSQWAGAQDDVKAWRVRQDTLAAEIAALEERRKLAEAEAEESEEAETSTDDENRVGHGTVLAHNPQQGGGKMAVLEDPQSTIDGKLAGVGEMEILEMEVEPEPEPEPLPPPPPPEPTTLDYALEAREERDFDRAIPLFWKAVQEDSDNPEVWAELSKTYMMEGDPENAEIAILEARRRDPESLEYTMTYLSVIEKSRSRARYMEELERAYSQIPDSPELSLAMARAYAQPGGNPANAAFFFREFLELAPNDPNVDAVRRELNALP